MSKVNKLSKLNLESDNNMYISAHSVHIDEAL